jgi:hypothetical protein
MARFAFKRPVQNRRRSNLAQISYRHLTQPRQYMQPKQAKPAACLSVTLEFCLSAFKGIARHFI